MTVGIAARGELARSPARPLDRPVARERLRLALAAALLAGGGIHLAVGVQHGTSTFGHLSVLAGIAQAALAVIVLIRPSGLAFRAVTVLSLVLFQLYIVNITVGLPPLIAHSHVAGTHQLWGFTLAWPGPIDAEGALARLAEVVSVAGAVAFQRGPGPT